MDVSNHQAKYGFGIDREKVVAQLRHTADMIEQGHIVVKEVAYTLKAVDDDFRSDVVSLVLVSPVGKD